MSFPRYERYKDSGVEWLGEVPEGWDVVRVKNIALINMGQSPSSEDCNQSGYGEKTVDGKI
jgi:type I restriction enzyme, S subunit